MRYLLVSFMYECMPTCTILCVILNSVCSALGIPPTFLSVWTLDALSCPGVTPQEFDPQNAGRNLIASYAPEVCVSITVKKNVMAGVNDFGNLDVFLDQHFLLVLEQHSYQRKIVVNEL